MKFQFLKVRVSSQLAKAIKVHAALKETTIQNIVETTLRTSLKMPPLAELRRVERRPSTLADRVVAHIRTQRFWMMKVKYLRRKFGMDDQMLNEIVREKGLELFWSSPDDGWHKVRGIKDPRFMAMKEDGITFPTPEAVEAWEKSRKK